jgi:hypothetical protein
MTVHLHAPEPVRAAVRDILGTLARAQDIAALRRAEGWEWALPPPESEE